MRKTCSFATALVLVAVSWVSIAQAQEVGSDASGEASQRFRRGVELFQEEAYSASLIEFERAYELLPNYRILYNIGLAKVALHDYLGAMQSYQRYLDEGKEQIAAERRNQLGEDLLALRDRIGILEITLNVAEAEIFVDENKVGVSPLAGPLYTNVGRHRVSARSANGMSDVQNVDIPGQQRVTVHLKVLTPEARTVLVRDGERPPLSKTRKWAIISWSTGGALLIGGAITGILAMKASDDLTGLMQSESTTERVIEDKRASTHTLAVTTDVLLGAGIAAAACGTLLWFLGAETKKSQQRTEPAAGLRLRIDPLSLRLHGRF